MKFEKFVENTIIQLETVIEHYEQSDNHYEYVLDVLKDACTCLKEFKTKGIIENLIDHERRITALEQDKKVRDTRDRVMSLFASMQYGKLCTDPERTEYYKLKLNEIFGDKAYVDTDSVKHDGKTTETSFVDESWHEDARRRGENI